MHSFKIWDAYDKTCWYYESAKLSYFTFKNGVWIMQSKHHVASMHDVSLHVRDSSTSSWSSSIISLSEILDKLAKLFDSNWYFLNLWISSQWQGVNKTEHTNWCHNAVNSVPVSWPFLMVKQNNFLPWVLLIMKNK